MKIALTADLHLTKRTDHPERYRALENILSQMIEAQIQTIVIAGDLFDASQRNYAQFEGICKKPANEGIQFYVIPGNHDATITNAAIVADNLHILTEPDVIAIDPGGPDFLLLPYRAGKTMGEFIQPLVGQLAAGEWILVGHGDWSEGLRQANPYEPGVYMPLTTKDVQAYQPAHVFLGHIHRPWKRGRVHYAGSPCGLDITETGRRSFIVYNTATGEVETKDVDTDVIFFDEFFVVLPTENEQAYVEEAVETRISSWGIQDYERGRVQVRVKVGGYSANRKALLKTLQEAFRGHSFYRDEEPDISEVSSSDDPERQYIAERVKGSIDELEWVSGTDEPDKREILLAALQVVYGD